MLSMYVTVRSVEAFMNSKNVPALFPTVSAMIMLVNCVTAIRMYAETNSRYVVFTFFWILSCNWCSVVFVWEN
jgi:hypothetical protein